MDVDQNINQIRYDVLSFALNNRVEILNTINDQTSHLNVCARIFDSYPEMFDDLVSKSRRDKLKDLIQAHFNLDRETVDIIADKDFVTLILTKEKI